MRILIHGSNYFPELTGIGKYTGEMAAWLASRGHAVRVVTAPPYYPEWKVRDGYAGNRYKREMIDGVEVYRCPVWVPAKPSGLKRILHLASFAIASFPTMLVQAFWKPDVVFVIEPPLFCAPTAWMVARLSGSRCQLHVQDFEVDAAFTLGILSSQRMRKIVLLLEASLLRRFDRVSSISASMVNGLAKKGVDTNRLALLPNWSDLSMMKYDKNAGQAFRETHRIPKHCFLILYSGNMGEKQGLEVVLQAAEKLQTEDIVFVLCGDGSSKERMKRQSEHMKNVLILDLQPLDTLPSLLSAADLHLIIQKADAADLVMPSKLTNILAIGGYSIITAKSDSELGRLVSENPYLGVLCPPGDAKGLIQCIADCRQNRDGIKHSDIALYAKNHLDKELILARVENDLMSAKS